jgi:hypothetical protein
VAKELIDDLLEEHHDATATDDVTDDAAVDPTDTDAHAHAAASDGAGAGAGAGAGEQPAAANEPAVYGDAAYGSGAFLDLLAGANIASGCKTQPPTAADGLFIKTRFVIDLRADTVSCPARLTVPIRRGRDGDGIASFGEQCATCPLRAQCTTAAGGRTVSVGRHEQRLADARAEQQQPHWQADYRATRPKVERKIGHLMRRKHGGRRARAAARTRSTPTSACWPPPSTSPASPCSDCAPPAPDGPPRPPDRPGRESCRRRQRPRPTPRPAVKATRRTRRTRTGAQASTSDVQAGSQRRTARNAASPDTCFTPAT